jgi:protein-disulfide isomerase
MAIFGAIEGEKTMTKHRILGLCVFAIFATFAGMGITRAAEETSAKPAASSVTIDVAAALAPRTLGDPKAPVKLEEFASLSCPHCAEFTKDTFEKIKSEYIDTGKVFYTFIDFPLNAPALKGSMVARCLPADRYFQFTTFLFQTQDKWAFVEDWEPVLRQDSKLLGMSDETYDACVNNTELKQGLATKMQEEGKANHIDSTPTFLFSNGKMLHGAQPFSEFQKVIDPMLAASAAPAGGNDTKKNQ